MAAGLLVPGRRRHRRREVRRVGRRQDAVRAHALLGSARQPVGLRRARPSSRRGNRAGAGTRGHLHAAPRCRSIAASWRRSTCAWRRARPRRRSATCSRRRMRDEPFVRLVGAGAARNQARRAHELLRHRLARRSVRAGDPRVGHRQPAEGRVGSGRAEHERHDRRSRRRPGCCEPASWSSSSAANCSKIRRGSQRWSSGHRDIGPPRRAARDRARRRQGNRRGAEGRRHREAAGRRAAHHRRRDARRRRQRAGGGDQHAVRRGADDRRRARGRADRRRRRLRAGRAGAAAPDGRRPAVDLGRVGIPSERRRRRGSSRLLAGTRFRAGHRLHRARRDGGSTTSTPTRLPATWRRGCGARRLVIAGTTPGVLDDGGATVPTLEPAAVDRLIGGGTATAGMIAKLRACEHALATASATS